MTIPELVTYATNALYAQSDMLPRHAMIRHHCHQILCTLAHFGLQIGDVDRYALTTILGEVSWEQIYWTQASAAVPDELFDELAKAIAAERRTRGGA